MTPLHAHYSYNCLTVEQFKVFANTYDLAEDDMDCDCDECGSFSLVSDPRNSNRCDCGNRRCYIVCDGDLFTVEVD
jgi:hypothetical protein